RLDTVLHVIYLVFNEGYSASSGDSLTRADLGRGHSPGTAAGRAALRARGLRPARTDAAARIAAPRAHLAARRADLSVRSGSLAVGPRPHRRGRRARRAGARLAADRPVHPASGDRGSARRGVVRLGDRLAADRGTL